MRGLHRRLISAAASLMVVSLVFAAVPPLTASASLPQQGGVVLDAYGGIHAFGGTSVNTAGAPYWPGFSIARSIQVRADGSGGWELDGWGGIHAFGGAPALTSPVYWKGWDIARALVVLPNETGGYVLDGWGGVHAFGTAPHLTGAPFWNGFDIARGLAIHYDISGTADGGWVLDAYGGVHAFGAAPAIASGAYYNGYSVWQNIHVASNGATYEAGKYGYLAGTNGTVHPYWTGWWDSGAADLVRDVYLLDPTNPSAATQPLSASAAAAWTAAHTPRPSMLSRPACHVPTSALGPGKHIVISLECQELNAFQDGHLVVDTFITSGEPALPTPKGHYSVLRKNSPFLMRSSWPYGTIGWYVPSWVQYVLWFRSDGYGIHDASWRAKYGPGTNLEGSHGCVNTPLAAERVLYAWAPIGTSVDVV